MQRQCLRGLSSGQGESRRDTATATGVVMAFFSDRDARTGVGIKKNCSFMPVLVPDAVGGAGPGSRSRRPANGRPTAALRFPHPFAGERPKGQGLYSQYALDLDGAGARRERGGEEDGVLGDSLL